MMVGAVAIAALPPLNGFVSKWLMYLSLMKCGLRNARQPQPVALPGRRSSGPDRRPGGDHLRSPHGHRPAGFAAQRAAARRSRILAVDARADADPGLPLPDRGGASRRRSRACCRAHWTRSSARKPVERCVATGRSEAPLGIARQHQRLDADRPRDGGGIPAGLVSHRRHERRARPGDAGMSSRRVRMQYTGRSFAEMIAEHLLPRFLRPRTTGWPRVVCSLPGAISGPNAPTPSAKGVRALLSALGGALFPAPHSPAGEGPRLPGLHRAHGRAGPGLGVPSHDGGGRHERIAGAPGDRPRRVERPPGPVLRAGPRWSDSG